jgi:hypothetical protein
MTKWILISAILITFSVTTVIGFNSYNATKAGLEECPVYGVGDGGYAIWVKSCKEYTELINLYKKGNTNTLKC